MSATEPDQHLSPVDPHDLSEQIATTHFSLSRAVNARKSEYTRSHRIRIKIGTWNVAGCPGTDKDLASWFVDGEGLDPRLGASLANLNLSEDSIEAHGVEVDRKVSTESHRPASSSNTQAEPRLDEEHASIRAVGGDKIGLYVLGLQEIVNLNSVHQSLYSDPGAVAKWQDAIEAALPTGYIRVASQQLVGLLLLIYASPEVAATISNESTVSTGTGLLGYMGNKGAVSSRLLLGETTRLVFSNCHLASGHDQTSLDRRCWDYNKIVTQTTFSPISRAGVMEEDGDKFGDEDFTFFFGDLNFRLDGLPGTDIRHLLTLHARGEYDITNKDRQLGEDGVFILQDNDEQNSDGTSTPGMVSRETSFDKNESDESSEELPDPDDYVLNPHDDPASLQATLDSLLPHDQLRQVMKNKKAFHQGWREGPITFLPTYKYDVGTVGLFDTSEKKRAPSWCDRILYRTRKDRDNYIKEHQEKLDAKNKDDDMKKRGIDEAANDESVLFDYDPTEDSGGDNQEVPGDAEDVVYDYDEYNDDEAGGAPEQVVTHDGFVDEISLSLYTSHQRIMSSDHKPLVGIFTLTYDAVVPELKAKVHAEVAKELDRVENEGRPVITILIDGSDSAATGRSTTLDGSEGIDFGGVAFMRRVSRSLTIANTGRVQASLAFMDKPNADGDEIPQPKWLDVNFIQPQNGGMESKGDSPHHEILLEPGETVNAVIEIEVSDLKHLQALNAQAEAQLEDVLVLRVKDGRDHFIPIRASWRPSCFGRSLEELIRIPDSGIITFIKQRPKTGSIPYSLDVQTSSPSELFKLIEAIESLTERLIADENMVDDVKIPREKAGWPFDRRTWQTNRDEDYATLRGDIMEALENGQPLLKALKADVPALKRLEIVSESLLLFLESMPDGIIPAPMWASIEQTLPQISNPKTSEEIADLKAGVLDIMSSSPYHHISFVFLTAMIAKVGSELHPLNKDEREVINTRKSAGGSGSVGRRSLSFRRNAGGAVDEAAIQRRLAWERRTAEIFGGAICRAGASPANTKEKEKKAVEDKMRGVLEMFLRKDDS